MLLIIMLYPVLVMGFKDLLAGLLGFMRWPKNPNKTIINPSPAARLVRCQLRFLISLS
jgi:hypothetical protein